MSRVYNPSAIKKDTKAPAPAPTPIATPVKTSSRIVMRRVEDDEPDPNDINAVKSAIDRDNELMNRFFDSGRRGLVNEDVLKKKQETRKILTPTEEQRMHDAAFSAAAETTKSNLTEDESKYGERYKAIIPVQMTEMECEEFRFVLGQMRGIPAKLVKSQITYKMMPQGHVEFYALMDDNSWKRIWDNRKMSLTESERLKAGSSISNGQRR